MGFGALLIALRVSPYLPPSSLRGLDLGPSLCLDFWHSSSCIPCPILALHLLPLIHLLQITGLLLTCMSEGGNLAFTIRQAILTLRHLADSLESALEQDQNEESHRVRSGPRAPASQRTPDWDLLIDSAASAAPSEPSAVQSASRVSESSCYNEVALLLTKAPQHCFDICSRLSGTVEFVKFRVQRAWEAGQWAKAVIDERVPKPRPTPKIEVKSTVYIVVRGPGVQHPVRVSSAAAYYQLVPKFTDSSISHGFPSLAEATVYCLAIGISLPSEAP